MKCNHVSISVHRNYVYIPSRSLSTDVGRKNQNMFPLRQLRSVESIIIAFFPNIIFLYTSCTPYTSPQYNTVAKGFH